MIVHDLKNSISPIELAIESIEANMDDSKYVLEMLALIRESARDGVSFVMDILDYASNKKIDKSVIYAKNLFDHIAKRMKPYLTKTDTELKVDCQDKIYFSADWSKMFRAITNLIKNAAEVLLHKSIKDPLIILSLTSDDKNIYINVSDNGTGIPKEIEEKLFTPFITSGKIGGTGLGLAIVKQIIEAHGGSISVDTSETGTTFKIIMPKGEN
jgi:signal transduction histidine kinase